MAIKHIKIVKVFISVVIAFQLVACDVKSADEYLDVAASSYALGKETDNIVFSDTEKTLDNMIEKFSGSYYQPEGKQLSDDEYIDLMKQLFDPDFDISDDTVIPTVTEPSVPSDHSSDEQPTENSETSAVVTPLNNSVASMDDLKRVIHGALDDTAPSVSFTYVSGFNVDLYYCIDDIYTDLQREDPIDASGVDEWEWWYRGNDYTLFIHYSFDVNEFKEIKKETERLVKTVAAKIQPEGKSEFEIVCAINDYLCDNVYYPEREPYAPVTHTAYGALQNGCAVCEGYACAAKLLLSACGVESDIEIGDCNDGGAHAWNLVKVNGSWYQLDICWNDAGGDRTEFLLVDDNYMYRSRTWDESRYPKCNELYAA